MEKIRVNMTPIEEAKTIHASQNDNATRKWAFDLYDENGKIDSSSIKEQMIFDSRVGGTEQILPENTSDPTTSPIIADIQYPDSLRSEQTFLYRESPTQQDGQAKITHIKGNTIVFNQLVENGNFADTSGWSKDGGGSLSASNNELTYTITAVGSAAYSNNISRAIDMPQGHKYYITFGGLPKYSRDFILYLVPKGSGGNASRYFSNQTANAWNNNSILYTADVARGEIRLAFSANASYQVGDQIKVRRFMIIDLTTIGIDNLTTTDEVEAWLSSHIGNLPYYDYTTGKLLPFVGTELKTTGKNLFNKATVTKGYVVSQTGQIVANSSLAYSDFIKINPNSSYYIQHGIGLLALDSGCGYDGNKNIISDSIVLNGTTGDTSGQLVINSSNVQYVRLNMRITNIDAFQFEYGTSMSSYEPYIESTTPLIVSDYFPSGMKSAGSVYDEITESKAITRVGSVDLGTLNWIYWSAKGTFSASLLDSKNYRGTTVGDYANIACDKYVKGFNTNFGNWSNNEDKSIFFSTSEDTFLCVRDTSYTSANAFKQAMTDQNAKLYYELATPTEEPIVTASLVTEKGEAPLYYDDELIADCNETISSESGIFDAKIKLMTDETIYSQKIQLHVERKPQ